MITIKTDVSKTILTSRFRAYKTEAFIRQTQKLDGIDVFLTKIFEGFIPYGDDFGDETFFAETFDGSFTVIFRFFPKPYGGDFVFAKFLSKEKIERTSDKRLLSYLERNETLELNVKKTKALSDEDFRKLYLLHGEGKVNFPYLNDEQRAIVETEDKNVLAQGVAGSGKTNVCIEKIVFCACRGYRGKVLYTTFSRGLCLDTQQKVNYLRENIDAFVHDYEDGKVVFFDKNHKKAVENKLGISFPFEEDGFIFDSLKKVSDYLKTKVDYCLIEDLYFARFPRGRVFGERDFLKEYVGSESYRLSGLLERVKNVSPELIYKEVYGMIYGRCEPTAPDFITKDEYALLRKDSFSRAECDAIYSIAVDYGKFLEKNGYLDNNIMSKKLLESVTEPVYSVGVLDEAQDFTQVNLTLLKKMCLKVLCVGDALQMINPSYFSFAYLKRLLYGEITGVTTLTNNYRNAEKIEKIVEKIGELNVGKFGVHNFVLKGKSVRSGVDAQAAYVKAKDLPSLLRSKRFENLTVIVSTADKKEKVRKILPKTEILTVAEAKGLERPAVVLLDVLSDDKDKWNTLTSLTMNRKTADENSVYRYYFNLFYVGVSRAKQYLLVSEKEDNEIFAPLFSTCFDVLTEEKAVAFLTEIAGKTELDDDELVSRIEKFIELSQYENAYFTSDRLSDETLRTALRAKIYVHETFIEKGDLRGAGMEYWKRGMDEEAKKTFVLSGDEKVIPLIDACRMGGKNLDYDIVRFYPLVLDNPVAKSIIIETLKNDYNEVLGFQNSIKEKLKAKRRAK